MAKKRAKVEQAMMAFDFLPVAEVPPIPEPPAPPTIPIQTAEASSPPPVSFDDPSEAEPPVQYSGEARTPIVLDTAPATPRKAETPAKDAVPKSFTAALLGSKWKGKPTREACAPAEQPRTELSSALEVPAKPTRQVVTVGALVALIRGSLERAHADVWIEGEISGCRPASSGHVYFTLKDRDAQLSVVLFRNEARRLRFKPVDGLQVLVRGRVSVYESRGQLQVIASTMEPRGAGALQLAFEQLKARLKAEGLFDDARKRPLPAFPRTIGLITSTSGAVLRDILHVGLRRHPGLQLLVYPAAMQGIDCSNSVVRGLRWFNARREELAKRGIYIDVLVMARGGGSAEDLCGFNDEELARAIADSSIPVVSAVGHQTDFTIADFVADLRAPTPSAAAEILTANHFGVVRALESLDARLHRAARFKILSARQRYARLSAPQVLLRLEDAIRRRTQRLDDLQERARDAVERRHRALQRRLDGLEQRLARQQPAIRLARQQHALANLTARLERAPIELLATRRRSLASCTTRLEALSPVAVLSRGYALVYAEDGRLLRDAAEAAIGTSIRARLAVGSLTATVTASDTPEK